MDTIHNLTAQIELCTTALSKINGPCKANIYNTYGLLLESLNKLDSARYYYDKSIVLSTKYQATEALTVAYCQKADLLTEQDSLVKATALLTQVRKIMQSRIKAYIPG